VDDKYEKQHVGKLTDIEGTWCPPSYIHNTCQILLSVTFNVLKAENVTETSHTEDTCKGTLSTLTL
jgi:hypothetical protein